jgi:transposase
MIDIYIREDKLSAEDIHLRRNKADYRSKVEAYFNHLASLNYSPTSMTGKAVNYRLKNKVELMTYLSDGHIPIDNNLAERGIKPFVINRKNFLFSNTEKGERSIKHLYEYHSNSKNKRIRHK